MIIISGNVSLSPAEELLFGEEPLSGDHPRIGYHSMARVDNITADQEAAGFPASNMARPATNVSWRGTDTDPQYVYVNAAGPANYLGLAGHNLASGVIHLQASDNGTDWEAVTTEIVPGPGAAFMVEFPTAEHPYWRLYIEPFVFPPEITVLHLGQVLRVQRRIYVGHQPLTLARQTEVNTGRSEDGHYIGRLRRGGGFATEVSLRNLTASWYRANFDPFVAHADLGTFFFAWRPAKYPSEVGYCWTTGNMAPVNGAGGLLSVDFGVRAWEP
jgi:hypothetical protein